jgi:hypothetical protein
MKSDIHEKANVLQRRIDLIKKDIESLKNMEANISKNVESLELTFGINSSCGSYYCCTTDFGKLIIAQAISKGSLALEETKKEYDEL